MPLASVCGIEFSKNKSKNKSKSKSMNKSKSKSMSQIETLEVKTTTRVEMVDVTSMVRAAIKRSRVQTGIAVVHCPHTTAGMTIQENADPAVKADVIAQLGRMVPHDAGFTHGEGNSDAHVKSSLVGCSETVLVDNGALVLGTWQGVFFCEFDGPRTRTVIVGALGSDG